MSRADSYSIRHVRAALADADAWLSEREIRLRSGIGVGATRQALWHLQRQGELRRCHLPGRWSRSTPHYALTEEERTDAAA